MSDNASPTLAADTFAADVASRLAPAGDEASAAEPVPVRPVRFPAAAGDSEPAGALPLSRFYDVTVTVTAELGRATLKLQDLLRLGTGAVIELGRLVDEPVDILAQGVRLGRGDVVAVDDRYAVRVTELERPALPVARP